MRSPVRAEADRRRSSTETVHIARRRGRSGCRFSLRRSGNRMRAYSGGSCPLAVMRRRAERRMQSEPRKAAAEAQNGSPEAGEAEPVAPPSERKRAGAGRQPRRCISPVGGGETKNGSPEAGFRNARQAEPCGRLSGSLRSPPPHREPEGGMTTQRPPQRAAGYTASTFAAGERGRQRRMQGGGQASSRASSPNAICRCSPERMSLSVTTSRASSSLPTMAT